MKKSKGISGKRRIHWNYVKIKPEQNSKEDVEDNVGFTLFGGRYRLGYKYEEEEEEEMVEEEISSRSNKRAVNEDNSEQSVDAAITFSSQKPTNKKERNDSEKHIERTIPQSKHRCPMCKYSTHQEKNYLVHLQRHTEDKQCLVCTSCGYRTTQISGFEAHMRTHTGEKSFQCTICFKLFTAKHNLQVHSMVHKDELPHSCPKCGRRFARLEEEQSHEKLCKRTPIICNLCHYKTSYNSQMKTHMQSMHGAKRPFECSVCSRKFVQEMALMQHLATVHQAQFPFKCSKCLGGYAAEDEKNAHEEICGCRQYQCHLCKEYRRDGPKLKAHMRTDHTGEMIVCDVCGSGFAKKYNATRHMEQVHGLKKYVVEDGIIK